MKNYPKNRKHCGYAKCNICGNTFNARGIGTHRREAHGIVKTLINYGNDRVITTVNDSVITTVNDNITAVNDNCVTTISSSIKEPTSNNLPSYQKVPNTKGKNIAEYKRPDETQLYTDNDLWILYGRFRMLLYSQQYPPHIMKERLVQDFMNRFDCKFFDVERANTHICSDKTFAENPGLASKYASLTYSR